jgi:hypothetical protein
MSQALVAGFPQVKSGGICGGQSVNGAGCLRVLRFPHALIPTNARMMGQRVSDSPSGLILILRQEIKKNTSISPK